MENNRIRTILKKSGSKRKSKFFLKNIEKNKERKIKRVGKRKRF